MSEWQTVKLIDVCVDNGVQTGPFGSQLHQKDYVEIGTPIITVEHLGDNRITMQNLPRVSHEDKERLSKYSLQEGDIVFSRVGSVDRRAYVRKEQEGWLFSGRCLRVRPNTQKIDPYYLSAYFGLPSFKEYVRSIAVGATMPSLNTTLLENVPIILPPKKQQELISHAAKSIEDKIELNQRMNETLEAMARALFKSWFVDFDPVRTKTEGRKPEGMDTATASLFPSTFKDEGLPEGWHLGQLDDLLVLQRGFDLPNAKRIPGKYAVMAASGLNGTHNEYMVSGPGVTTGRSGVLGNVFFIHEDFWPLNTSLWIKEFKGSTPAHAFYLLQGLDFAAFNAGSAVPTLNRNHVHSIPVPVPPKALVAKFDEIVMPWLMLQRHNELETQTLSSLRDALLPKLISGELRFDDGKGKHVK